MRMRSRNFAAVARVATLAAVMAFGAGCSGRMVETSPDTAGTSAMSSATPPGGSGDDLGASGGAAVNGDTTVVGGSVVDGGSAVSSGTAESTRSLTVLSSTPMLPAALAVYAGSVYFTDLASENNDGSVWKLGTTDGSRVEIASAQRVPAGLAVDSSGVYWSAASLMQTTLDGKYPTELATGMVNDPIAVGPGGIYGTGAAENGAGIVSAPLAGGKLTLLTQGLGGNFESYGVAVDAKNVYWTTFSDPMSIMAVPLQGGTAATLATSAGPGGGIAIDQSSVYWVAAGTVMKVPLTGGVAIALASAAPNSLVSGIAVDDTSVYWTSADSVLKVSINGGAAETLASGQGEPGPIAVDANGVYWGNLGVPGSGHGSIVMLTPK